MLNKRGQFYIVTAIIIILVISSMTGVATYAYTKLDSRAISDISSELKEEGPRIIDYGVYTGDKKLDEFTSQDFAGYFLQKTEGANIVFVYGDKNDLKTVQYKEEIRGTISLGLGDSVGEWVPIGNYAEPVNVTVRGDEIIVTVLNTNQSFELRDNEMFYFVIAEQRGEEIYVETNK